MLDKPEACSVILSPTKSLLFWDKVLLYLLFVPLRFWNIELQPRYKHHGSMTFCSGNADIFGYYITPSRCSYKRINLPTNI
jgi:hypothetical protein